MRDRKRDTKRVRMMALEGLTLTFEAALCAKEDHRTTEPITGDACMESNKACHRSSFGRLARGPRLKTHFNTHLKESEKCNHKPTKAMMDTFFRVRTAKKESSLPKQKATSKNNDDKDLMIDSIQGLFNAVCSLDVK